MGKNFSSEIEAKLNEMDINDPILVAIRARKTDLKKKAALPKVKKISTKQYYKLMDMESDIIDKMKDAAKEYQRLDSEMNQDAGQKGSNWTDADANRYGGDLDKLQTKIEKLAKQKLKVKKAIMSYRINKTNGDLLVDLVDGQIDITSTNLTLVGRNYTGFGEFINENFIKILENFSGTTAPGTPLTGQLWFDTTGQRLKVYNGTTWE